MKNPYGSLYPPDRRAYEEWAEVVDTTFLAPPSACRLINTRRGESAWIGLEITGEPRSYTVAFTDRDGRLIDVMHIHRETHPGDLLQGILASFARNDMGGLTADRLVPALAATYELAAPTMPSARFLPPKKAAPPTGDTANARDHHPLFIDRDCRR